MIGDTSVFTTWLEAQGAGHGERGDVQNLCPSFCLLAGLRLKREEGAWHDFVA